MQADAKHTSSVDTRSDRVRSGPSAAILLGLGILIAVLGSLWTERFRSLPPPLESRSAIQKFFTPVERNAFMRMPVIQGDLSAIDALKTAPVVWAVGSGGL